MTDMSGAASREITGFEDLIAWQKARHLAKEIYTDTSKEAFSRDYGLKDQIRPAAVSVMPNVAEGFERGGRSDFHQFLVVAKSSCAEAKSQLHVAADVGYLSEAEFNRLGSATDEVSRITGGLRASAGRQRNSRK